MVYARQLFDEMHKPRSFLWNTLIKGYVKNERFIDAILLYGHMHRMGVRPDKFTFPFVLKGCGKLDDFSVSVGEGVHVHVLKFGVDLDVIVRTELMVFYAKFGELGSADYLFESMADRDLVSWNALITAYAQNRHADKAIGLFRQMNLIGIKPDAVTFASTLSACAHLGCLQIGEQIDQLTVNENFETNMVINNARLDLYAKCGDMDTARYLFDEMSKRNVISWSTVIGGYAINGDSEKALDLFTKMQAAGMEPNHVTFLGVLSACSHAGLVNQGRSYFNYMVSSNNCNIHPRIEHYACMVDLLGRAGLLEEAYQFIKSMPMKPDSGVWGALLSACRIHQNTELSQHIAKILCNIAPQTASYRVLLSNIYAASGRWGDVEKVRLQMRRKSVKKIAGYSSFEATDKICVFFNGGDQLDPMFPKVYDVLEELSRKIKDVGSVPVTSAALHELDMV
ncbi:Pentatricopeptide repeat-containing protein [Thalictrum thalictroides]|uniref:Pentatricopeptide repeat-containing protein n=1 Tax=Thalictrum thalictroides TaxID=46969 RepID=A0A7J6VA95_THATH|nr:Pentatricopeptide repeat-containing protein [Thalictrum thalictroides]